MKSLIIEGNEGVRIEWHIKESIYTLQVYDNIKGWVPLIAYDAIGDALAGMESLVEYRIRKEEE